MTLKRTPPPKMAEVSYRAGLDRKASSYHFTSKGKRVSLPVMVSAHTMCQDTAADNLADIMTVIHEGVDNRMIEAVYNIHAPIKDRQHRDYTISFLHFLCETQEAGRQVSFVRFYVATIDKVAHWRMECIIDGLAWQVQPYSIDECKLWLGLMPFYGSHKDLAGVLTSMFNGLNN